MKFVRWIFFPFSILYGGLMRLRNWLYNKGLKKSYGFSQPIIAVGNLSFGGTGKSPHIEYLINLLGEEFQLCTISRGYGRKTKGFLEAEAAVTAEQIGDEPYQFYRKYGASVKVAVGEDRVNAIQTVLKKHASIDLFLLDDGFQHRRVQRDLNLLLSDYNAPFYKDVVLPAGNLREPRVGANRADAVLVTKCPTGLPIEEKEEIKARISRYNKKAPVFFSSIKYGELKPVFALNNLAKQVILISGIANPKPFEDHLKESFYVLAHYNFTDHHQFDEDDLTSILELTEAEDVSVITTEKDMVRLLPFATHDLFMRFSLFYLPITVTIDEAEEFEYAVRKITESIKK
ncbi:tetraacyldisaccharide 4'-kinase [Roseivirga pacifica]|uniref:tetraacyldisaccharide 4'-kinase n=1 Tax=Roseivirga pacifica TaxID=1267423 RepID=UPI002095DBF5|nr:tetraacyldisaccharide 4'-kinase [Roseivirga pacifica]